MKHRRFLSCLTALCIILVSLTPVAFAVDGETQGESESVVQEVQEESKPEEKQPGPEAEKEPVQEKNDKGSEGKPSSDEAPGNDQEDRKEEKAAPGSDAEEEKRETPSDAMQQQAEGEEKEASGKDDTASEAPDTEDADEITEDVPEVPAEESTESDEAEASSESDTEPDREEAPSEDSAEDDREEVPSKGSAEDDREEAPSEDSAEDDREEVPSEDSTEDDREEVSSEDGNLAESEEASSNDDGACEETADAVSPDRQENPEDMMDAPDEGEESVADKLSAEVYADRKYAFVDAEKVKITANISGGVSPYTVSFRTKGAADKKKTVTLDTPGKCAFTCMPESFGVLTVNVEITDANGVTVREKISVDAPVNYREKPEKWEADFADAELSGDWREDLLTIAVTQLGYEESDRNFIIAEDGSVMGYTRYGDWYGREYNDWCSLFVCFCMHYAGIPESDYPRNSISNNWKRALERTGAFEDASDYGPVTGDLVFFSTDEDSRVDHMGIVEFADGKQIHTIEGNSGKKVTRKCYDLDDSTIVGYANTAILMERALGEVREKREQPENKPKSFVGRTAGTMVNIRQAADADSAWIACIPEAGTQVTVKAVEFNENSMWYRISYETYEGYILGKLLEVDGYTELIRRANVG